MGELLYLRQKNLNHYHARDTCLGSFQLLRKNSIQYPVSPILLQLNNAPFVACELCQTAYFPKGFESWLHKAIVSSFFSLGKSLPGSIYRMARHLADKTSKEIALEIGMPVLRYQKFEQQDLILHKSEEVRIKLCLSRFLNLDAHEFKGVITEEMYQPWQIHDVDVSSFPIKSWF